MKRKIKVLIDVFYYQAALSGIRTYTKELVLGAEEFGSKNIEYSTTHNFKKIAQSTVFLNSSNPLIKWFFHGYYFIWKQLLLPIKIWKEKPDVVICPDYVAPFWKTSAKKIAVIHDALFWEYPQNYNTYWRKLYLKQIHYGLTTNSTIVTTSEYSKEKIAAYVPEKNTIEVIYQSFNKPNEVEHTLGLGFGLEPQNYLLHVGSFDQRKDLLTLVRAFKILKEDPKNTQLKLVLAGEKILLGNDKVVKELEAYINENNLAETVLMPGYLSRDQVASLYKNALLYVFPSVEEGFGIPILEAFSNGLPVIASNTGALKEIGGEAASYFSVGDEVSLSKEMERLINSGSARENLISKGNGRIKLFSRKRFIQDFEKIIESNLI